MLAAPHAPRRWAALYEQQLAGRLRRAARFVQENRPAPDAVQPHFASLLTLLENGWERPSLHPQIADLILALHPLPYRWGRWEEWLRVSRRAAALLARLERPVDRLEMLAGVVDTLFELGQLDDAVQIFAEMWSEPTGPAGGIRPLIRAGHRVSTRLMLAGRATEGDAWYQRQRRLLAEIRDALAPPDRLYAEIYLTLQETLVMRRAGRQAEAAAAIEAALAQIAAWPAAPPDLRREAHHHHGGIRLATGEFALSVQAMEQAIQCAVEVDDPFTEASLYMDMGMPLRAMGELDRVETAARRGIYLFEKMRANWRMTQCFAALVETAVCRGEFDEALRLSQRHAALARQTGDGINEYSAKIHQGMALFGAGQREAARRQLAECAAFFRERELYRWLAFTETNLAQCLGETAAGREMAQQAIRHAQQMNSESIESVAWRGLALLQKGAEREASLQRALRLARRNNAAFNAAATLLLLAKWSAGAAQARYWAEAADLLRDMGIEHWLDGRSPQDPPCLPILL